VGWTIGTRELAEGIKSLVPSPHPPLLPPLLTPKQEGELRRLVTPEKVCGVESMVSAVESAMGLGLNNLELLSTIAPERLAMALEQLPLHDPQVGC
jgi:hypothetical protein